MSFSPERFYRACDPEMRILASAATLDSWRSRGEGPPYIKRSGRVLYKGADLLAWLDEGRIDPAAAGAA